MIDLDRLDELHQEGDYETFDGLPFFIDHGCLFCHKPWPCQIARLSVELRWAYTRIEELERK